MEPVISSWYKAKLVDINQSSDSPEARSMTFEVYDPLDYNNVAKYTCNGLYIVINTETYGKRDKNIWQNFFIHMKDGLPNFVEQFVYNQDNTDTHTLPQIGQEGELCIPANWDHSNEEGRPRKLHKLI